MKHITLDKPYTNSEEYWTLRIIKTDVAFRLWCDKGQAMAIGKALDPLIPAFKRNLEMEAPE